tara:strand:- start:1198 stop:1521 length:324 start_codon:yes stop_codon:yes gene_type:complete
MKAHTQKNTMKRRFLSTSNAYRYTEPRCRWVNVDEKNWVDGETPVEDFGMFFFSDIECTPSEAMEVFFALMIEGEGEFDYRGDPITDKPEDELKSEASKAIYASLRP